MNDTDYNNTAFESGGGEAGEIPVQIDQFSNLAVKMVTTGIWYAGMASTLAVVTLATLLLTTRSGRKILASLWSYWGCLIFFWVQKGSYADCPYFRGTDELHARVHVFSLALIMTLWDKPHYRNGTFQDDMHKNLRNVAVPGTGVPLSVLCYSKIIGHLFLVFCYPLIALVAAINATMFHADECQTHNGSDGAKSAGACVDNLTVDAAFAQQLLAPQDWFSFWRLNCRLATFHSCVTQSKEYGLEDKWVFLSEAAKKQVPVSPCLDLPGVILKHRNEEGGMGFARYFGASAGGDWLIQPILKNGEPVARLLPKDAPLSTFRVITSSRYGIPGKTSLPRDDDGMVQVLSTVFRAGLAGAATDHQSILFDVDIKTGVLRCGTTNSHWYELGLSKTMTTPWTSTHNVKCHPDTKKRVQAERVQNIEKILGIATDAHRKLCPQVPLVGWDVAITEEHGMLLLEGNFSCNFFRGQFDLDKYLVFMDDYFKALAPSVGL